MTEGPFFVEEMLERVDLISGEDKNVTSGTPLEITLGVFSVDGMACMPLSGATVDIWHADVDGVYSDVEANFLQATATTGRKFLRAYQVTDEQGMVTFRTIYPGWYGTRTIHIHLKIRVGAQGSSGAYEWTSQMFFDEKINDIEMERPPYNTRGQRNVRNDTDQVYKNTGAGAGPDTSPLPAGRSAPGKLLTLACEPLSTGPGYSGSLKIGMRMA